MRKSGCICTVEGCNTRAKARGLCSKHYMRMIRNGTTDVVRSKSSHVPGLLEKLRLSAFFPYRGRRPSAEILQKLADCGVPSEVIANLIRLCLTPERANSLLRFNDMAEAACLAWTARVGSYAPRPGGDRDAAPGEAATPTMGKRSRK